MELWIRSQERNILEKVSQLYVTTYDEEEGFGIYARNYDDLDDCDIPLGFYKTRERALEVLDQIQDILRGKYIVSLNFKDAFSSKFITKQAQELLEPLAVYEMPKE